MGFTHELLPVAVTEILIYLIGSTGSIVAYWYSYRYFRRVMDNLHTAQNLDSKAADSLTSTDDFNQLRVKSKTEQPTIAQDMQVIQTMREIFIFLTLSITVRFFVDAILEFKQSKDEWFYSLLILRKLVNISLIIILSTSIRRVLNQLGAQKDLETKIENYARKDGRVS